MKRAILAGIVLFRASFAIALLFCCISCLFHNDIISQDSGAGKIPVEFENYSSFPFSDNISTIYLSIDSADFEYLNKKMWSKTVEKPCRFLGVFNTDTIILNCMVKIHGQGTRAFPKKSLRLLFKEKPLVSDNIFRLFPHKEHNENRFSRIVLKANANDFSYIRNFLSLFITGNLGAIVPRVDFVRVYVNKKPFGLYQICEMISGDMVSKIAGHTNLDLLSSEFHAGNLKSDNMFYNSTDTLIPDSWKKDSIVSPAFGFEVTCGDTTALCNFVHWLESDSADIHRLRAMTTEKTLYSYFAGCYYTGDNDALFKNYYFLYDKRAAMFEIIRWDADATLGRGWSSYKISDSEITFTAMKKLNGVYSFLAFDSSWIHGLHRHLLAAFNAECNAGTLLSTIDELKHLLETEVLIDLRVWRDTLLSYFSQHQINAWEYSPSDTLSIWHNDLEVIREFIKKRETIVRAEIHKDAMPYRREYAGRATRAGY